MLSYCTNPSSTAVLSLPLCLCACCLARIIVSVFLQCLYKVGFGKNTTTTTHQFAIVHQCGFQAGTLALLRDRGVFME